MKMIVWIQQFRYSSKNEGLDRKRELNKTKEKDESVGRVQPQ